MGMTITKVASLTAVKLNDNLHDSVTCATLNCMMATTYFLPTHISKFLQCCLQARSVKKSGVMSKTAHGTNAETCVLVMNLPLHNSNTWFHHSSLELP